MYSKAKFFTIVSLGLAILALTAAPVFGQALKGTVLGTVTDPTHAVIPSVSVNITEVNTNFHRMEATNESGFFAFANLDPGTYRIDIQHPGFGKMTRSGIVLDANTTVRADAELTPGGVQQVIDVTAEGAVLQTDRSDTGAQIGTQQLDALPLLNNRNYQNSLLLVPGASVGYRSNSPFFNSQESLQVPVNGLDRYNNFMIEGLDNNIEGGNNLTAVVLPADAIGAVNVSTTAYDPEIGRAGAAAVNVIMKSGTNSFHGSLFEYHSNNALQARNVFDTTGATPHAVHNQFGASAGGHIIRDRLFYFADFQDSRDLVGQLATPTIPTMAMRTGNFAESPTVIYDPATGNTATGANRTPFANQTIPDSRISSIFKQYMSFLPPPTTSGLANNVQVATDQSKDIDAIDTKIDFVISSSDRLFFRYSLSHINVTNPGLYGPGLGIYGGPSNGGFDATGPSLNQSPGINYNHIFSPTLVTELRLGVVRNRNDATNVDTGMNLNQKLGIPNGNLGSFWTEGLAEVFVNGYDTPMIGVNGCLPWRRSNTNFEVANNWTKTKGTHIVKWGFDGRYEQYFLLQTATYSPRGRFTFAPGPTTLNASGITNSFANSFASFVLDQPNSVGRDLEAVAPTRRTTILNLYFQDKWQVSSRLTVDLGARWEDWLPSHPQFPGGSSNYDPSNNTLLLAGLGKIPLNLGVKNYVRNVYPRLGFAYRLNDKTVVRGGFGMSNFYRYDSGWQYPIKQTNQLLATNSFVAAGSMAGGFPAPALVTIPSNGIITDAPNQNFTIIVPDHPVEYTENWNLAIQRSLPGNFSLDVAYVGNHAVHTDNSNSGGGTSVNINAATEAGKGSATEPLNIKFGRTATTTYPWPQSSYYEALQVKFNRRYSNGFLMTTSYAFGKSIDYGAGNYLGFADYKGLARQDRRHIFTYNATYELPFGKGKKMFTSGPAAFLLGGWQINGLWTWEGGQPLNFSASSTSLNAPGNSQKPDLVGPVEILGNWGAGAYWFTPTAFANPKTGLIGNVGRNILKGPRLFAINGSVFRRFNLTERFKAEFRAEAYNLTNTKQLDLPDTTLGDAAFGQITTAHGSQPVQTNPNRLLQGSVRITF
jgi:Carboxypeptidase regulatory-like domain